MRIFQFIKIIVLSVIVISIVSFGLFKIKTGYSKDQTSGIVGHKEQQYLQYILKACEKHSNTYKVEPLLVLSLIKHESEFEMYAVSQVGAAGLMQLMTEVVREASNVWVYEPEYFKIAQSERNEALKYREKAYDFFDKNMFDKAIECKKLHDTHIEQSKKLFKKYREELLSDYKDKDKRFVPEFAIDRGVAILAWNLKMRNGDIREAISAYNAGLGAVERSRGIPPIKDTVMFQNKVINSYKDYMK